MEEVQSNLAELKQQGAETSTTLRLVNETLKGLSDWMPQMDDTVRNLQKSLDRKSVV